MAEKKKIKKADKKAEEPKKKVKVPKPAGPGSRSQGDLGTKKVAVEGESRPEREEPVEAAEGPAEVLDEEKDSKKPDRYMEGIGRRKTAIARVRLFTRAGDFVVNNKPHAEYFPTLELQSISEDALQKMKLFGRFRVSVKVSGGGIHSQAEALRHGLARALVKFNPDFRKRLKRAGYLKRDPRAKERKKPGLKRARRAPQWAKR